MPGTGINRSELKEALKEALAETLSENREVLHEIFAEVLEDFIHTQVIRDNDQLKNLHRGDVFPVIEGKA